MSGEAYEMPDGLLTMDAADAADAWYREASALRSRVEALEGFEKQVGIALNAWEQGAIDAVRLHHDLNRARAALQPDKGERCGGGGWTLEQVRYSDGSYGRTESHECPGCPDCSEAP